MGNEMKLKPCPFCGRNPKSSELNIHLHVIECSFSKCHAHPWVIKKTREEAAAAWNTRASGWIPCRERMPEDGQRVLICTGMRKMFVAEFDSTGNIFRQRIHQTCHTWYMEEVAHWMPLPEPPGGDDNA